MPRTDLLGWRLKIGEDNHGQHKWVYLPDGPAREAWPQTKMDKYAIGLEMVRLSPAYQFCGTRRKPALPNHACSGWKLTCGRTCRTWGKRRHRSKRLEMGCGSIKSCKRTMGTLRLNMEVCRFQGHLHMFLHTRRIVYDI